MSETKVAIALLAGFAAGTAIGILFAPEPGTETRDKLTDTLSKLGESIRDCVSEHINNLADIFKGKFSGEDREEHADDLEHA